MSFQSGFSGEYEGFDRLQLIQLVLRGLGSTVTTPGTDDAADYSRYPKADIVNQLTIAESQFNMRTDTLTTFAIVEAVANRTRYRLPRRCMKITDAKFYTAETLYEQLTQKTSRTQMKRVSRSYLTDTAGRPEYIYPGYGYGNVREFAAYPRPSTDGTTYDGSTMGVVTAATDFTFTGNITGTHKTGFGNSAFLVDNDGRNFAALGVTVGMMIFNTTDGSSGQITAIGNQDATNDKISVTLSGGTDDDFDTDDSFVVTVGEYGVVIRADNSEEWAFSSTYGALQDITPLSGNFLLEFVKRPLLLDLDTQFPEIPPEHHHALAERAIWKLGGAEYNSETVRGRAAEGQNSWLQAIADYGIFTDPEIEYDDILEDREALEFGDY